MNYVIRRVSLGSTLRFGLVAGALFGALPGLCLGGLAVQLLRGAQTALSRLEGAQIDLPDISFGIADLALPVVPLNFVEILGLGSTANQVDTLGASAPLLFIAIFLGTILGMSLLFALPMLLLGVFYNTIAPLGGGFRVDVAPVKSIELLETDARDFSKRE